jgi:hypothetical protein
MVNVFCYVRYLNINNKHIIYVSVHFYKNFNYLKNHYYKEKNSLQQTVKMINPIILGEYNIKKKDFHNICRNNFENYTINNLFTFNFEEFDSDLIILKLNEFKYKLTELLESYYISTEIPEMSFIQSIDSLFIKLV